MEIENETKGTIAVKSDLMINGQEVRVLIDSGAATNIITNKLRRRLGIRIKRPSKTIFTMANGKKTPSLGETEIRIEITEEIEIPVTVQVIDSVKEDLILGTAFLVRKEGEINFKKEKLIIKHEKKQITIPIQCMKEEQDNETDDSETESEESEKEDYEQYEEIDEELEVYSASAYLAKQDNEENNEKEFKESLKIGELEEEQLQGVKDLLMEYKELLALSKTKLGKTGIVKHRINTERSEPIAGKPYRTDEEKKKIIKEEIQKMEEAGVIRKSDGPWASPVVIVEKKDGSKRFCIDYRKINAITVTDAHPLPRIDDLLEQFRKAKYFTSLDLASGYWQVEMEEEDKKKTAFTCHLGLYEFNVMPFGLKNAPPTFQRLMNHILKDYLYEFAVVYIDDILIYSKDFEEHMEHIRKVFDKLREAELMIKLKKCKFCEGNIEYLGHIVGRDGLKPDSGKIEKIKRIKEPTNVKTLRAVLGLFSYYRKFIKDFSRIAKPMNELLKKDITFEWGERQQGAFEILKRKLVEKPILGYPVYEKPFLLFTDASGTGLGAVLSQENEKGGETVIAYASRSLTPAEKNYPITDQECLAIVWGIQHFHKYLTLKSFTVITDHSALKSLQKVENPTGRRARWIMKLQQYNFEVVHRAGKSNKNADAMSRVEITK